jgi:hypothetical protein
MASSAKCPSGLSKSISTCKSKVTFFGVTVFLPPLPGAVFMVSSQATSLLFFPPLPGAVFMVSSQATSLLFFPLPPPACSLLSLNSVASFMFLFMGALALSPILFSLSGLSKLCTGAIVSIRAYPYSGMYC